MSAAVVPKEEPERWAPIKADPTIEVSTLAKARCWRKRWNPSVILDEPRPYVVQTNCHGSPRILVNGRYTSIGELILETFVGPRPSPEHLVHHIDSDEKNCWLDNIEWATLKEITAAKGLRGEDAPGAKLTDKLVIRARRLRWKGWSYARIRKHLGLDCSVTIIVSATTRSWRHLNDIAPPVPQGKMATWTRKDRAKLLRMAKRGATDAEIGKAVGRTGDAVCRYRKYHSIAKEPVARLWSPQDVRTLKSMSKKGLTDAEIAKKLGRTTRAVTQYRNRHGIAKRKRKGSGR